MSTRESMHDVHLAFTYNDEIILLGFCYALTPRFYQTALSYLS